jgi:hypothetical protein
LLKYQLAYSFVLLGVFMSEKNMSSSRKFCVNDLNNFSYIQVSQKWRTNGALRCRIDYRKRQKNVKKILLNLFADLAVFESGT